MKPKKHLGQHFLTAPAYARRIALAIPADTEGNVLEIGPGQGALSIYLKERFPSFHCVEVDEEAIDILSEKLGDGPYTVHHHDILTFNLEKAGDSLHVTGNLPYGIGALIIKKVLLNGNTIRSVTFMVQREVAERIVAEPHSKVYGFLSVFCSFFGVPKLLFHVPPGAFFPRPNVDSSVFQIILENGLEKKLSRDKWEPFFALVSKGFMQRRKMVINALSNDVKMKTVFLSHLHSLGIAETARAEDLSADLWLELFRRI